MARKKGKVYMMVRKLLRFRGMDLEGLEIVTQSPGSDHLVVLNGETIGKYNHISKRLFLYSDLLEALE